MRHILDTGVLIAGSPLTSDGAAITAITLAELEFGVVRAAQRGDGSVLTRMRNLERARAIFGQGLPFGGETAPHFGRVVEAELGAGRNPRARLADLMIAAIALQHGAALLTTNPADFAALVGLIEVVGVTQQSEAPGP
ncbi:VapC toxin family PIN domain ribonuclease [Galbitalea sp. SE-J8]|uniref:PIN domain-containing protein n=1 Tax=Galbitalea sp. SE-J8 TaxID=3054952 RepID=UPI00259C9B9E|nr:PIN domain-containing protein [Galbitalea sp. SE-J8]MDM4762100.1 VapC toxin family PIN domain ribonuclease [Galbitalea sp. SE-J8]